ncbi:CPED1 [Cordylochernes scorpioides]|uniref:CPED1 n=1 Tax=Cordylochernes scorpioides TaxID=51811 RepID=A0ABY6KRF5_9ARAC|nr:CPED1 [Cordylochernes scorpioides]
MTYPRTKLTYEEGFYNVKCCREKLQAIRLFMKTLGSGFHQPVAGVHTLTMLLFVGDSTNRGMMHYLMERLNGSLTSSDKTHHIRLYPDLNRGRTFIGFSYYPQFWLPTNQRPVFDKALYQLIQRSRPLANDTSTVLVVGGVHWLATQHLHMLLRALKVEKLQAIRLFMKTLGSGFHQPVAGVHTLTMEDQRKLLLHSLGLAEFARHYNIEVIETFNMTVARYKDFLQGKCACHFHRVRIAPESTV